MINHAGREMLLLFRPTNRKHQRPAAGKPAGSVENRRRPPGSGDQLQRAVIAV
jgi:hypothetical protein